LEVLLLVNFNHMDSAMPGRSVDVNSAPQDVLDLGTIQVTTNEDGNLKSRKFIISMYLITVSSTFTGLGMMDVDTWMMFTGAVGAAYLGVNIYQKNTR
jgi:hypothetical protein